MDSAYSDRIIILIDLCDVVGDRFGQGKSKAGAYKNKQKKPNIYWSFMLVYLNVKTKLLKKQIFFNHIIFI